MDKKQKSKEKSKAYREKNAEKYKAYNKMYVVKMATHRRNYNLKFKFGISLEDYRAILNAQNNKCAICLTDQSEFNKALAVDHCHITNKVRGLLCSDCNRGLGLMRDNIDNLKRAIKHLERLND